MSVRFVIGRAGTGKTHHCLSSIRQQVQASPVDGPPLVMLVPEQASMQMERLILAPPITAVSRAQVLSFTRLAQRVLSNTGHEQKEALSATARIMVLRRIVARLSPKLRYYRRTERLTGFFERLGQTLGEFIEEAIEPDELMNLSDGFADDPQREAKFSDLSAIYSAYIEFLGDDHFDPTQYLKIASEQLVREQRLEGAVIWVDGFAGFTGSQVKLLTAVATQAADLEITMVMDPTCVENAQTSGNATQHGIFAKPHRTYLRLKRALESSGVNVSAPVLLNDDTPRRFSQSPDLANLERAIHYGQLIGDASDKIRDIHIASLDDHRSEVEFAVAQVCSLVASDEGACRYRDIAIIVRDLDPYHDLLASALADRGIPFFIDRRRTIAHHGMVEFLRAIIGVVAEDFSVESARLLVKSGLTGLDEDQCDELENYILACGVAGQQLWCDGDWEFAPQRDPNHVATAQSKAALKRLNRARLAIVSGLESLIKLRRSANGSTWCGAIRKVLDSMGVADQVEAWAERSEQDGQVARAAEHRQVWVAIETFLDDFENVLADETHSIGELRAVIEAGLAQLTLGLVPPTVDQVLVGSIERSRHPELKTVILLGFNEGTFPLVSSENPIVNDDDRDALDRSGITLGVTSRQSILDEKLLVYVALTRPSQKLLITYSNSNADGKPLRPSSYVETLTDLLPAMQVHPYGNAFRHRAMWSVMNVEDLSMALANEMRHRPDAGRDDANVRTNWNDLYMLARSSFATDRRVLSALSSLEYKNIAVLGDASVNALLGRNWVASVSELETFAACPFQRFAKYGLKLNERRDASLKVTDLGTVQHAVLEEFIEGCIKGQESFADIEETDVLPRLESIVKGITDDWAELAGHTTARDAYQLARSSADLAPIVKHQQRVTSSGNFAPRAVEKKFGFSNDPDSLPPLELNTPKGRLVRIRGLIDRVDLAELADECVGMVVDYKRTRNKRLDLASAYHGLSLQLLGYLLVLADRGVTLAGRPIKPLGAFYVSLMQKYEAVDHPSDASDDDKRLESAPRGILNFDQIDLLERDGPETGASRLFSVFRKKDGELGNVDKGDGANSQSFDRLLAHTRYKLGELSDQIIDGDVSVLPYRLGNASPCEWCDFRSVCRFEFGQQELRHLPKLKRSAVFTQLEGQK
ncbi:MAG: ATP-dependent helicase/deoxyribonuclease subunit B [Phycisphaerae bacterium]|nr:MAG: ATP-dependent helicase/deoxyribonuclease subunit B [Phycisphaerae bacterium]